MGGVFGHLKSPVFTHTHTCMHAHTQLYTVTWKLTHKHILINSM